MRPQTQSLDREAPGIGWQLCVVFLNIISILSRTSVSLYAYRPISQARHHCIKKALKAEAWQLAPSRLMRKKLRHNTVQRND